MHREYTKWFSHRLNRDMELLIFGHAGTPVLVFPTSMGKFFEFEDRGMVETVRWQVENGHLMFFCVDGIDKESFYCSWAHPAGRIRRHVLYDDYVLNEVVPLMRHRSGHDKVVTAGASFGAYHCFNFAMRHPEAVHRCVAMSGAYDIRSFLDGYYDNEVYFNNPVDYLSNLSDGWYLDQYRHHLKIVLAAGEHDICLGPTQQMSAILNHKGIPHWYDFWGLGAVHDWPLWREMMRKYFA